MCSATSHHVATAVRYQLLNKRICYVMKIFICHKCDRTQYIHMFMLYYILCICPFFTCLLIYLCCSFSSQCSWSHVNSLWCSVNLWSYQTLNGDERRPNVTEWTSNCLTNIRRMMLKRIWKVLIRPEMIHRYRTNKYIRPRNAATEMYAGRVACCSLVSHDEYAPRALLKLENKTV